jgi:hypothetical protein
MPRQSVSGVSERAGHRAERPAGRLTVDPNQRVRAGRHPPARGTLPARRHGAVQAGTTATPGVLGNAPRQRLHSTPLFDLLAGGRCCLRRQRAVARRVVCPDAPEPLCWAVAACDGGVAADGFFDSLEAVARVLVGLVSQRSDATMITLSQSLGYPQPIDRGKGSGWGRSFQNP